VTGPHWRQRRTQSILTYVERVTPAPGWRRIAIRYYHFTQRSPIKDGAGLDAIVVGHSMEDQPLARVERVPQRPLLPPDLVAEKREVGPLGLQDLERLQLIPQWTDLFGIEEVELLGWDGDVLGVQHFNDLFLGHIDEGDHPFDDAGIGVGVVGIAAVV